MTARQSPSESERVVANLTVTNAAKEYLFAIENAEKAQAIIERQRREGKPAAEGFIRSRPDEDDEPRYTLIVFANAEDTDGADGGEPFKRYTLSLTNYIAAERRAFNNAVRRFPGAAQSTARKVAQKAREAYKRAWRGARACDVADEEKFRDEVIRRMLEDTRNRPRKKRKKSKGRTRLNPSRNDLSGTRLHG
jgi:hypothetical protein